MNISNAGEDYKLTLTEDETIVIELDEKELDQVSIFVKGGIPGVIGPDVPIILTKVYDRILEEALENSRVKE